MKGKSFSLVFLIFCGCATQKMQIADSVISNACGKDCCFSATTRSKLIDLFADSFSEEELLEMDSCQGDAVLDESIRKRLMSDGFQQDFLAIINQEVNYATQF